MQRKHAAASVTRCTIHLPPTAVGEGDYGIPCAGQSQGSPISHRSIWESLRHSESGTHLLGVHAELEITLANGHMYIHIIFKVSSTRRGQPRFHCSQGFTNKTGAATLSFQSKFHQQDGGSHAFIPAEFINKYIQTNFQHAHKTFALFFAQSLFFQLTQTLQ